MRRPAAVRVAFAGFLLGILLACGGGGGGGDKGVVNLVQCGGATAAAPNQVALGCPAQGVDSIAVTVHLGGPTTTDIYGLQFDLVFDPAVVQFEPQAIEGSFLNRDGAATILQAGVMQGDPGRLIVAIARQGVPNGLQATNVDQVVMLISFRRVAAGSTTLSFENAKVVDSSLQTIPQITFGTALTLTLD